MDALSQIIAAGFALLLEVLKLLGAMLSFLLVLIQQVLNLFHG